MTEPQDRRVGRKPRDKSELEAYVAVLVKRAMIDLRRRERRAAERDAEYMREREASVHTWMDPEAQWMERECTALYDNTLALLPPPCAAAFVAVREDGRSYAEAAQHLGISVKMVAKHMTHAHRVFRRALLEAGFDVPREKAGKKKEPTSASQKPASPAWAARPRRAVTSTPIVP